MPKHALKLLVLSMLFSVAPASAGPRMASAVPAYADEGCPYERARLAAAENQAPTTITLTEAVPAYSSLSGVGRRSALLTP